MENLLNNNRNIDWSMICFVYISKAHFRWETHFFLHFVSTFSMHILINMLGKFVFQDWNLVKIMDIAGLEVEDMILISGASIPNDGLKAPGFQKSLSMLGGSSYGKHIYTV